MQWNYYRLKTHAANSEISWLIILCVSNKMLDPRLSAMQLHYIFDCVKKLWISSFRGNNSCLMYLFLGSFNGKIGLPSQLVCMGETLFFPLSPSAWTCPDDPDWADAGVLPPQPGNKWAAEEAGWAAGQVGGGSAGTWAAGSGTPPGWGWVFLDNMKNLYWLMFRYQEKHGWIWICLTCVLVLNMGHFLGVILCLQLLNTIFFNAAVSQEQMN